MKIDSADLDLLNNNIRIRSEQTKKDIGFGVLYIVFLILILGFVTCMTNYKVTKTLKMVEEIKQSTITRIDNNG